MAAVLDTRPLTPDVTYLRIEAPKIARRQRPGQFVIVRVAPGGERIPLTIADSGDKWIALIVQAVGKTTAVMSMLQVGDEIADIVGPLGTPSEIEQFGTVVVIGGGVGTAIAYPTARALTAAGNRVTGIVGGRTDQHVILEEEMRACVDQLHVTTDDGSAGVEGFVTGPLQEMIDTGVHIDRVLAIGPIPMMRAVADVTRPASIPTVVSLNPIMVDGTGMCGGCRVRIGGESKFACIDGPEFDAHLVDFELLDRRNRAYLDFERDRREELETMTGSTIGGDR